MIAARSDNYDGQIWQQTICGNQVHSAGSGIPLWISDLDHLFLRYSGKSCSYPDPDQEGHTAHSLPGHHPEQ